jgi:hypothetical protein
MIIQFCFKNPTYIVQKSLTPCDPSNPALMGHADRPWEAANSAKGLCEELVQVLGT